jgi:LEA14-like dessication related protein
VASADYDIYSYEAAVLEQDLEHARLTFPWSLENTTDRPVRIVGVTWTLFEDDALIDSGHETRSDVTPARYSLSDALEVKVPVHLGRKSRRHTKGRAERSDAMSPPPLLHYRMEAVFDVNSRRGREDIEADWGIDVWIPQRPRVTMRADAARYDARSVELNFAINITNPNPFELPVDKLDYALFVEGRRITTCKVASSQTIKPGAALSFQVHEMLGKNRLPRLARRIHKNAEMDYRLEGRLRSRGLSVRTPAKGSLGFR